MAPPFATFVLISLLVLVRVFSSMDLRWEMDFS